MDDIKKPKFEMLSNVIWIESYKDEHTDLYYKSIRSGIISEIIIDTHKTGINYKYGMTNNFLYDNYRNHKPFCYIDENELYLFNNDIKTNKVFYKNLNKGDIFIDYLNLYIYEGEEEGHYLLKKVYSFYNKCYINNNISHSIKFNSNISVYLIGNTKKDNIEDYIDALYKGDIKLIG